MPLICGLLERKKKKEKRKGEKGERECEERRVAFELLAITVRLPSFSHSYQRKKKKGKKKEKEKGRKVDENARKEKKPPVLSLFCY